VSARRTVQLVRDSFPGRPAFDTAVSRALLERVSSGELPETVRLARPGAMVAFGKLDAGAPGYGAAARAAREHGFEAVLRLAGGRAAVFHEQTVALAWARSERDPLPGTHARFRELAGVVAAALRRLGIEARVGEVAGEYCPGDYSVNAGGRTKLAGIGQRVIKGGAHLGGVVVADGSERLRDVLIPVYAALGLDWDPRTAGSVADELGSASFEDVERALEEEIAARYEIVEATLDAETLALAAHREREHTVRVRDR
jgi:octanoyl-[GcvH]:protein N-octanoyltransferase